MHLPPSVQPLEIVWAMIGVFGLGHSVPLAIRFYRALQVLKGDGLNGGDEILAWAWLGIALFAVAKQGTILLVGVTAMLATPAVASAPTVTPTLVIITVGLIGLAALSSGTSWWMLRSSDRIANYLRAKVGKPYITEALRGRAGEGEG